MDPRIRCIFNRSAPIHSFACAGKGDTIQAPLLKVVIEVVNLLSIDFKPLRLAGSSSGSKGLLVDFMLVQRSP